MTIPKSLLIFGLMPFVTNSVWAEDSKCIEFHEGQVSEITYIVGLSNKGNIDDIELSAEYVAIQYEDGKRFVFETTGSFFVFAGSTLVIQIECDGWGERENLVFGEFADAFRAINVEISNGVIPIEPRSSVP